MAKENLVLLHGWGFNQFIWDPILSELNKSFNTYPLTLSFEKNGNLSSLCHWIAENTPENAIYLGWSLGGLVAMAMSLLYPQRVKKLISVCGSPHFIESENWPGIKVHQLDLFSKQYQADPSGWAQKFIHSQLGSVDVSQMNLSRFFESQSPSRETLEIGLHILKNTDIRSELKKSQHEKLFIFGRLDRITPAKTSDALLKEGIPNLSCETIKRAAHMPFLSHPDIFLNLIRDFSSRPNSNRKLLIKKSFNGAASTYHEAATLQGECAEKLLMELPQDFQPKSILELGSGTGLLTQLLIKKFPEADITAIDIAEKMLGKSKDSLKDHNINLICADAESLPFHEKSFDLIISNFTLQWCELRPALKECERVLNNGAYLYFCTLGENTLSELKTCWQKIDRESHINEFPSPHRVLQILREQDFQNVSVIEHKTQEYHDHPMGVISRIKAWGAQNIHHSRPRGLCGKNKFKKLIALYQENFQEDKRIYASYHTLYGSARKN